jgi:hypothetical protein
MVAALAICASSAYAQSAPEPAATDPSVCKDGKIKLHPKGSTFYPNNALTRGIEGHTVAQCTVGTGGLLEGCRIIEEEPKGWGFGAAHLRLLVGAQAQGCSPGQTLTNPMTWKLRS